jgi:hypothetical protein
MKKVKLTIESSKETTKDAFKLMMTSAEELAKAAQLKKTYQKPTKALKPEDDMQVEVSKPSGPPSKKRKRDLFEELKNSFPAYPSKPLMADSEDEIDDRMDFKTLEDSMSNIFLSDKNNVNAKFETAEGWVQDYLTNSPNEGEISPLTLKVLGKSSLSKLIRERDDFDDQILVKKDDSSQESEISINKVDTVDTVDKANPGNSINQEPLVSKTGCDCDCGCTPIKTSMSLHCCFASMPERSESIGNGHQHRHSDQRALRGQNSIEQVSQGATYKRYSLQFKNDFMEKKQKHGLSIACLLKNVSVGTASKWVGKFNSGGKENLVDHRIYNGGKHDEKLESYVLKKFIELRTKGLSVTIHTLQTIALSAPQGTKPMNFCASVGWVQKFLTRNNITRRRKTHVTSQLIATLSKNILAYFDKIQEILSWKDDSIVFLNVDEVPLYFDMSNDYTFHFKGEKQIKVISHTNAKTRLTFMPCISNRGDVLPPLFTAIYSYAAKSDRKCPIKYENLTNQTSPYMLRFCASGMNNEEIFSDYILKVIKPWKEEKHLNPVLVFDEAGSHLTEKVQKALAESQILPLVIPGGATSLSQPLDVEINKPIKSMIRKDYTNWLESRAKIVQGNMDSPELLTIIDWSLNALASLSENQTSKSFISTGISQDLCELYQADLLHQRLSQLIDEHLAVIQSERELLDDIEDLYSDSTIQTLQKLSFEQELEIYQP